MMRSVQARQTERPERSMRQAWLLPLSAGIISVAAGLIVLATPWTVGQLAVFAAIIFIVRGIAIALDAVDGRAPAWLGVFAGVAGVLTGIWLLAWPGPSLVVLAVFIGAWLTVSGVFNAVGAVVARRETSHWGLVLAIGIIEILLGMWAMRRPDFSLGLAITVLGFWAIITGVLYIAVAFELRSLMRSITDPSALADDNGRAGWVRQGSPVQMLHRLHEDGLLSDADLALLLTGVADGAVRR